MRRNYLGLSLEKSSPRNKGRLFIVFPGLNMKSIADIDIMYGHVVMPGYIHDGDIGTINMLIERGFCVYIEYNEHNREWSIIHGLDPVMIYPSLAEMASMSNVLRNIAIETQNPRYDEFAYDCDTIPEQIHQSIERNFRCSLEVPGPDTSLNLAVAEYLYFDKARHSYDE